MESANRESANSLATGDVTAIRIDFHSVLKCFDRFLIASDVFQHKPYVRPMHIFIRIEPRCDLEFFQSFIKLANISRDSP